VFSQNGTTIDTYEYDPFGEDMQPDPPSDTNATKYKSSWQDKELYHDPYRAGATRYDPMNGRSLTPSGGGGAPPGVATSAYGGSAGEGGVGTASLQTGRSVFCVPWARIEGIVSGIFPHFTVKVSIFCGAHTPQLTGAVFSIFQRSNAIYSQSTWRLADVGVDMDTTHRRTLGVFGLVNTFDLSFTFYARRGFCYKVRVLGWIFSAGGDPPYAARETVLRAWLPLCF
jgi:hypothetical protein